MISQILTVFAFTTIECFHLTQAGDVTVDVYGFNTAHPTKEVMEQQMTELTKDALENGADVIAFALQETCIMINPKKNKKLKADKTFDEICNVLNKNMGSKYFVASQEFMKDYKSKGTMMIVYVKMSLMDKTKNLGTKSVNLGTLDNKTGVKARLANLYVKSKLNGKKMANKGIAMVKILVDKTELAFGSIHASSDDRVSCEKDIKDCIKELESFSGPGCTMFLGGDYNGRMTMCPTEGDKYIKFATQAFRTEMSKIFNVNGDLQIHSRFEKDEIKKAINKEKATKQIKKSKKYQTDFLEYIWQAVEEYDAIDEEDREHYITFLSEKVDHVAPLLAQSGFTEMANTSKPGYHVPKDGDLDYNRDNYKGNAFSQTDKIAFKEIVGMTVTCEVYKNLEIRGSDHLPVKGVYRVKKSVPKFIRLLTRRRLVTMQALLETIQHA